MARPRAFDEDEVLERATDVFWQRGYEGASIAELTEAMGLNAPSLYATFGSKRGLMTAVLDRYDERRQRAFDRINAGATAREVAERALSGIADAMTASETRRGCLLVQGGVSCGPAAADVPADLAYRRGNMERSLAQRFERAKAEGDLGADADPMELAQFLSVIWNGIAVKAAGGAPREELRGIAARAMKAWPT